MIVACSTVLFTAKKIFFLLPTYLRYVSDCSNVAFLLNSFRFVFWGQKKNPT